MNATVADDADAVDAIFKHSTTVASREDLRGGAVARLPVRWTSLALLASAILIAVCGVFLRQSSEPNGVAELSRQPAAAIADVATLLVAEGCHWQTHHYAEGERLAKGSVRLDSGFAVIRFDGGAEVVLQGDCALNLISAGRVYVDHGDVIVRASEEATGFRVDTPSSELIDLGTEFSLQVDATGQTKLNVLEGEVSIRALEKAASESRLLGEGDSVIVENAKSTPRATTHENLRFASVIKKANLRQRPDLRLAYEGFFYDEGDMPLSESLAGHGWQGPWRKRTASEGYRADHDTTDSLRIAHGKMNVPWGVRGGELGMLEMPPGMTVRLRELKRSIDMSTNGVYYFTLLVREPDQSGRSPRLRPKERARITFRSRGDYFGEALSFGVDGRKARVMTGQGVGFRSASRAPTNQTTLWVGKVIARADRDDEIYFRIFGENDSVSRDELTWAEPPEWDVASRDLDLNARLDLVVLTSEGNSPRYIDELRIGPTWRSVAPLKP